VRKGNIKIDCKKVWKQISNFLEDELPPDLRATMAAHFRECAHCAAILDGTRNVVQLLGDGRVFDVPAGAGQRLYDKLSKSLAKSQAGKR
jgi:Putative zinc-finger